MHTDEAYAEYFKLAIAFHLFYAMSYLSQSVQANPSRLPPITNIDLSAKIAENELRENTIGYFSTNFSSV